MDVFRDGLLTKKTIAERGKHLLATGVWSDCSFVVGSEVGLSKEFRAHKLILSMTSPVFGAMFDSSLEKNNIITITDVQPEAFATLLEYIYTDELELTSFDQACELCYVAKKYLMPFLVNKCSTFIWKDLDLKNVLRALEFANLFDQEELVIKCKDIIKKNTSILLKDPDFLKIPGEIMKIILDLAPLNVSEIELFAAVASWIATKASSDNVTDDNKIKEIAEPYLRKIRFLSMNSEEFGHGPGQSPLLRQPVAFAILMALTCPENKSLREEPHWPEGFEKDVKRELTSAS